MKQIHWHEGLFLQQHHLQQLQKGLLDVAGRERRLALAYPFGVVRYELSRDALKDYWVNYDRLHVVMPKSRLEVYFPDNADLAPRNLKAAFAGKSRLRVFLAVPLWSAHQANAISDGADSQEKVPYNVVEEERADENTGLNPQPILFRKIRARLLVEGEDDAGMETIEVLRLERDPKDPQSAPSQDSAFAPPSLLLSSVPSLWRMARDLKSDISVHRDAIARKIKQSKLTYDDLQIKQFEKIMRLRSLNRSYARLSALLGASVPSEEGAAAGAGSAADLSLSGGVSPFALYSELSELLGELSALRLGYTEYVEEAYDHEEPYGCLKSLCDQIRGFLISQDEDKPEQIEFKQVPQEAWLLAALEPKHLPNNVSRYYLGIKTDQDPGKLQKYVEDPARFRLLAAKTLGMKALLPGVKLIKANWVPPSFPGSRDLYYFELQTAASPDRWDEIVKDNRIGLSRLPEEQKVFGVDLSKATFTLYMMLRPQAIAQANPLS